MNSISTIKNTNLSIDGMHIKNYEPTMIKELRARNKVSQGLLAKLMNTSLSTVRQWESGYRQPSGPSLKLLNIIERHGIDALL